MRTISDTIERLNRYRGMATTPSDGVTMLEKLVGFGSNPGDLAGWYQRPGEIGEPCGLVVVLHGCTQTAAGYDIGSGWSTLARDYGFAVLYPEQNRQNNPNLCFNWFNDADISRGDGEVLSIREMIGTMISDHGVDPRRVFVTGLSAGGAMANALLASYPEVFAGGAIIAGLPYAAASTVPAAFDRMRGHGLPSSAVLQTRLSSASSHTGPWPTVSVWHGTADNTVVEANAAAIVDQWRVVHDVPAKASITETVDGHERKAWKDPSGRDAIELHRVRNMAHGTPLDSASGYGKSGPYMLDVGISSTVHIARGWGLTPSFERKVAAQETPHPNVAMGGHYHTDGAGKIQDVIEGALRAAGLMK